MRCPRNPLEPRLGHASTHPTGSSGHRPAQTSTGVHRERRCRGQSPTPTRVSAHRVGLLSAAVIGQPDLEVRILAAEAKNTHAAAMLHCIIDEILELPQNLRNLLQGPHHPSHTLSPTMGRGSLDSDEF
jgi:hypothetical protein